jgi:hypothetical protein
MFLDRVGKRKDDWPRVGARHRLDHLPREQFAQGPDADGGGRLEVLDCGDDLWVLGRQVEMIEALAGSVFPPLSSSRLSYQIKTTVCNLSPRHKSIAGVSFSIHHSPPTHNVHR